MAVFTCSAKANWYADLESGAMYINAPSHNAIAVLNATTFVPTGFLESHDGDDFGAFYGGKIGWSHDAALFGDLTRFEASGFHARFQEDNTVSILNNSTTQRFGAITPNNFTALTVLNGGMVVTQTSREIDFWGYDLLVHQDKNLGDGNSCSVYGGASFINLDQNFLTRYQLTQGAAIGVAGFAEKLDTNYLGGKVGAACRHQLNENWNVGLDGSVGFYHARTNYAAIYADSINGVPNNLAGQNRSANDFAFGATVKAEITRQINSFMFITAFTNVQYLSYAPQIDGGNAQDVANINPAGSRLSIQDAELFGIMSGLRLTIVR